MNKILNIRNNMIVVNVNKYLLFENQIKQMVEDNLKKINSKYNEPYKECELCDKSYEFAAAMKNEKIIINRSLINKIYHGDKLALTVLFHELYHVKQYNEMFHNEISSDILLYIKDYLLNKYQQEQNQNNNLDSYYLTNYSNYYREVTADIAAINNLRKYALDNNIIISKNENEKLDKEMKILERKKNNKNRIMMNVFGKTKSQFNIDEAFDMVIENKPQWLDDFPQLRQYYQIVDDKVVKKEIEIANTK